MTVVKGIEPQLFDGPAGLAALRTSSTSQCFLLYILYYLLQISPPLS
jgi:hypothetical protein